MEIMAKYRKAIIWRTLSLNNEGAPRSERGAMLKSIIPIIEPAKRSLYRFVIDEEIFINHYKYNW